MKYAHIAKILGWTEEPANASEGFFLQPEELHSINASLANVEALQNDLNTAQGSVSSLQEEKNTLAADVTAKDNRITELENEVATLKDNPSGTGSKIKGPGEEITGESADGKKHVRYDDPEHPANKFAASVKKYDSGLK